ncbi:MAG: leucine-rich repeat domain-containing protein, partial [Oscillospiraceae bacterium]|nr:leucine-rich repeat domain-containing protein [Oscillospiraceae bacterium]
MKKLCKRAAGALLALVLTLTLLPGAVQTAEAATSGSCGDDLTWTLDDAGTLTISGTGKMKDWTYNNTAPWHSNRSSIKKVTIGNSVTSIGDWAFYYCTGLTSVTIPDSVTSIGDRTFSYCSGLTSVTIPDSVTSIGDRTFSDCSGLMNITIPASVTSIGYGAFEGCS